MTELAVPHNPTLEALKAQYGRKAQAAELEVFAAAAAHLRLSIPAGEIALVAYGNVNNIQITLEGRRTIAQRTGRLRGIRGPEWCGPREFDPDGRKLPLDWETPWTGEGMPYAARCFVLVDGWDEPVNGTCKYAEFFQGVSPVWKKYPSHMLGNAAEKLALRRGFSAEIGAALTELAEITGNFHIDDDTDLGRPDHTDPDSGPAALGALGEVPAGPEPPPTIPRPAVRSAAARSGRRQGQLPVPPPARPTFQDDDDVLGRYLEDGWTVDENGEWHAP